MAFDSPENSNNAVKIFYHENWRIGFFSLTLLCIGKCIAIGGTGGQSPKGKKADYLTIGLFHDWTIGDGGRRKRASPKR